MMRINDEYCAKITNSTTPPTLYLFKGSTDMTKNKKLIDPEQNGYEFVIYEGVLYLYGVKNHIYAYDIYPPLHTPIVDIIAISLNDIWHPLDFIPRIVDFITIEGVDYLFAIYPHKDENEDLILNLHYDFARNAPKYKAMEKLWWYERVDYADGLFGFYGLKYSTSCVKFNGISFGAVGLNCFVDIYAYRR